ncbi:prepilin peptidase [Propionicicella superfundia]|uniref:prepilin peptidase n=1 Tax=Propionicicella superfundia TaxID=348582 RepID=UPI0004222395|nr:A24 family peptidase [Propionicicella superfundia]
MPGWLLCIPGLFGLAIGSFGNVVAYRVPAGLSLTRPSHCPHCDAPVRWWQNVPVASWLALRGRCATCRAPIRWTYPLVEAACAALFVLVTWFLFAGARSPAPADVAVAVALWWLAAVTVILTVIDLDTHRLPDVIVLPGYPVAGAGLLVACLLGAPWPSLGRAVAGMAILAGLYGLLRLIRPDGMGGGDVKLAGLLGLYLGWFGWGALAVGTLAGFVLGGLFGIALIAFGRAGRRSAIPYGPWMLAGAWLGIVLGEPVATGYLRLVGAA